MNNIGLKKVLIVTDLFHASPRISGLCSYIREFGWEPVILTTPLGENPEARMGPPNDFTEKFRVIEVPYQSFITTLKKLFGFGTGTTGARAEFQKKYGGNTWKKRLVKKILMLGVALVVYPDELRAWRHPAIKRGKALLSKEKFDAILSSSSPVTSHRVAKALKEYSGLPWSADFRDLWTQNHNYPYPGIRKFFERMLEQETLRPVNTITTVSESLVQKLQSLHGTDKQTVSIRNGFDPAAVNDPPAPLTKKFTITYTGTIYREKQLPEKIFEALSQLIDAELMARENIEVRFYGASIGWLYELIDSYNLRGVVKQYGYVPRQESFLKQRESQILLILGWEDEYELGVFFTKFYEYLAARRPILATGGTPKEHFRALLDEANAGRHAVDVSSIKTILFDFYREYLKTGSVSYHGISSVTNRFSYMEMSKEFTQILDGI